MRKELIARNAACNAIVDSIDLGSLYSSGRLCLYTDSTTQDSTTMLTWMPMAVPAYQDATDGTAIANPITDSTSFFDGTADSFIVVNRDGTACFGGSVVKTGTVGDMHLAQTFFPKDSTISISSAYYLVPA